MAGGIKKWGRVSTHNGLIGMLERGEIDVALADLSLTQPRSQVLKGIAFLLMDSLNFVILTHTQQPLPRQCQFVSMYIGC